MEAKEFVKYAKSYCIDDVVANFFAKSQIAKELPADLKAIFETELRNCCEMTLFSFFTLIDGVGGSYEGVFEIIAVDEINRTLVNPQNTEMLHDLLSEVIAKTSF